MSFPLGKPIATMICLAGITSISMLFRPPSRQTDLVLWTFAEPHARMYRGNPALPVKAASSPTLLQQFETETGKSVRLDLVATQALDVRLLSMFMSGQAGDETPDLAEVEISSVGKYFRPPADQIGFRPLNDYLEKSGWLHRILPSRLAPWSKQGKVFGIPHDLHPSTVTYRKDLFDEAGVELDSVTTWNELQERCLRFQRYWNEHGRRRIGLGLSTTNTDMLLVLLQQQHENLIDSDLTVHLRDEKFLDTLSWYAQAVAGPRAFAGDFNPAPGQQIRDVANGDVCCMITPDWLVGYFQTYAPDAAGKLRMIPLPRFNPDDARTASWGGTMIGITKHCRNPDAAWRLIETLYLDRGALRARQTTTNVLPPIPEYWSDPPYQQPNAFYGGQYIDRLYLDLANELPARYVTPYTATAQLILAVALNRAVEHVRAHGTAGLESQCRQWLNAADDDVRRMIAFDQGGR